MALNKAYFVALGRDAYRQASQDDCAIPTFGQGTSWQAKAFAEGWKAAQAEAKQVAQVEPECGAIFDRFDICEAHYLLESDYNVGGVLQERPSNIRRSMSTGYQLSRMNFKPAPGLSYETMTDNGKDIYDNLVKRYKLPE